MEKLSNMTPARFEGHAYCTYCGHPFGADQAWPRTCAHCARTSYINPLPVSVTLLPVDEGERRGLLVVRRTIEPGRGQLALPGGFIEAGETWQAAAVRELQEETGIDIGSESVELFWAGSAPDGTLLLFGLVPAIKKAELPPFIPRPESSERHVIHTPVPLAFSLHTEAVRRYFASREVTS